MMSKCDKIITKKWYGSKFVAKMVTSSMASVYLSIISKNQSRCVYGSAYHMKSMDHEQMIPNRKLFPIDPPESSPSPRQP